MNISCFECANYESSKKITIGKGKKKKKKEVIGYCKVYKKCIMEIPPLLKDNCEDFKEKDNN